MGHFCCGKLEIVPNSEVGSLPIKPLLRTTTNRPTAIRDVAGAGVVVGVAAVAGGHIMNSISTAVLDMLAVTKSLAIIIHLRAWVAIHGPLGYRKSV